MRKVWKILKISFLILICLLTVAVAFFIWKFPKVEPPGRIHVEITPERLKRGEYLVKNVVGCVYCHAERNEHVYSSPVIPGTEGKGSLFLVENGSTVYAPNITPYGIRDWTDGELERAITSGVDNDGRALFPIMPYNSFANLSEEDLHSIVAYVRNLKPIENRVPETRLRFPLNLIVRTIPHPANPKPEPDQSHFGQYLATIAVCAECHTERDRHGNRLPGMDFAGGNDFGVVTSANITPDPQTGIGKWSKSDFISVFKRFALASPDRLEKGDLNTVMPWTAYAGLNAEDLGAIYDYLRIVKPVKHNVQKFHQRAAR